MPISLESTSPAQVEAETLARSDALRAAGLIEDPGDDDGLVFPLPEGAEIDQIIRGYDTRDSTSRKVRCAACKQHQWHNRGFRVGLRDKRHARIGINCGEHHFGVGAWQAALADYDRRVEHANYVARVKPSLDAIDLILPELRAWHERWKDFARWFARFQHELPDLAEAMSEAAKRRDGRLEREKGRTKKRTNRFGREESYRAVEIIEIARIPYAAMFTQPAPHTSLALAKHNLETAHQLLSTKSDARSLAQAFAEMRRARQTMNDAAEYHQGVVRNLATDWLAGLCKWANLEGQLAATYRFDGAAVIHDEDGDQRRFEWLKPAELGDAATIMADRQWP